MALGALACALAACAGEIKENVPLGPKAENVEIAIDTPSASCYKLVGKLEGEAASKDLETARRSAKNDLRNKAAALGATFVTIDEDTPQRLLLDDKTKVTVVGRAYKAVDD